MLTLAQDTIDLSDPMFLQLGSISAVIFFTMLAMQGVKPLVGRTQYLKCVPVWCYTLLVAIGLTVFANKFLKTLPGDNVYKLIWRSALSVLGSAGLFKFKDSNTAVGNVVPQSAEPPVTTMTDLRSHIPSLNLLFLAPAIALVVLLSGCSASPTSRLAAADQAYTLTLNTLSDLRQFGYLDDAAARRVEQARLTADTTLNLIRLRIAEGSTVDPSTWESLSNALAALIRERLTAEEAKRERATSRPSGSDHARGGHRQPDQDAQGGGPYGTHARGAGGDQRQQACGGRSVGFAAV